MAVITDDPTIITKQAARRRYLADLRQGVTRFLQPRRDTCPWCTSASLTVRLQSPDIVQVKPGRFTLEQCRDCGHVFQNPQLNSAGLEFYYRDLYDGLGTKNTQRAFSLGRKAYRRRAQMLQDHARPRNWLDVGAGYGHFCHAAKQIWPHTTFDGLDLGTGILTAQHRGWISHAYQALFPDLAPTIAGRYDVVSMHHYLEHTTDPLQEIKAAAQVLPPGGHLIIEMPDPQSTMARLLGRYWLPWLQPQHLHLIPLPNLTKALAAAGFTTVTIERKQADIGLDFTFAAATLLNTFGPKPHRPWAAGPATLTDYIRYLTAMTIAAPAMLAGLTLDLTLRPLIPHRSNTYRLLARRT